MARILAYTSPARGHLYPLTPILDELRSRGHQIALRTLSSEVELMRSRGFDCESLDPVVEGGHDDYLARTPQGALKRALRTFARRAEVDVPATQAAIEQSAPDAVLVDVNTWGAQAVAEASGLPWATWCPFPLPLSSPDVLPFGPGLAPARGPLGRLRDAILRPVLTTGYARAFVPAVNQIRAQAGLAPLSGPMELYESTPLVLYLTAEPFEYPSPHWPENIVMVGPCAWEPPSTPPDWLDRIERPIVLVTTSSEFQNDARLVHCALEALSDEDVHVVATLPAQDPQSVEVPANAQVERFVPHGPVLERAVCAVTHGGMGATQKALASGVPVCAVPFGRDQLEVARRVEVSGAGSRLPARRLHPQRLRAKVRQAIACRPGAERIASAFRSAGGATAAADAIEQRLLRAQITSNSSTAA
ncbi:MAG: glycosyltransferase [Solirubrobacteraceae bacterium]|nr:MAG: glycosyl transferase [Solirubrobacterales bacterium]